MQNLAGFTAHIEEEIKKISFEREPRELYEPIKYILDLGGKRIRPALVLMAASLFSENPEKATPAALAIEVFHNFTLMHDDIMDKADVRRGKATVHKIWNDNSAILSGDAAMILSYQLLSQLPPEIFTKVFPVFNETALEVCEGQQLDMDFEERVDVILPEYLEMIRLKTSVLIAASLKIGAIIGGACPEDQEAMYEIGQNIGLSFQVQDDYLDCFSDAEKFGKATGGDILNNKKTYLLISALNRGDEAAIKEITNYFDYTGNPEEKINAIKTIYRNLGVDRDTQLASINFMNIAVETLNYINVAAEKKKPLEDLMFKLTYREK